MGCKEKILSQAILQGPYFFMNEGKQPRGTAQEYTFSEQWRRNTKPQDLTGFFFFPQICCTCQEMEAKNRGNYRNNSRERPVFSFMSCKISFTNLSYVDDSV